MVKYENRGFSRDIGGVVETVRGLHDGRRQGVQNVELKHGVLKSVADFSAGVVLVVLL